MQPTRLINASALLQHLGSCATYALLSRSCSSISQDTSRQATPKKSKKAKKTPVQPTFTLQECLAEAAAHAAPGTACPVEQQQSLEAASAAFKGGYWSLISCGEWDQKHSQAGQPAHAILHTLVYRMKGAEPVPVLVPFKQQQAQTHEAMEPLDGGVQEQQQLQQQQQQEAMAHLHGCFYHFTAHALDSNGWPCGLMYPTLSALELLTTRRGYRKPSSSIQLLQFGKAYRSLDRWAKRELLGAGLQLCPRGNMKLVKTWYTATAAQAGISMLPE